MENLTITEILIRMILGMLFSGILGYEREQKGRPAGFRTYIVVCMGAEIAMMTGSFLKINLGDPDSSRIAAQVISGISFLGAGTILVTKQNQVKGLTTAAGLWAGACLGLALGAGFYSGAIVGFFTLWCAMRILHSVDKLLSRTVKVFSIYVEFAGIREVSKFLSYGREVSCIIDEIQVTKQKDSDGEKVVAATMPLHFARAVSHEQIIEEFGKQEGVLFILEV